MQTRASTGRWGESHAADFLERRGYRIIERNWRCARGEIDLVAEHDGWTAIVEVKTRNGIGFGHPFDAITPAKLRRLRTLAACWASAQEQRPQRIRIDAVGVTLASSWVSVEHLTGIS
ncbi:MAG: YraN family protein [Mycetocola sp.]